MTIRNPDRVRQGRPPWPAEAAISPRCLESLWVRLKVGGRLRPRDAEVLRRLALPPFDRSTVYEVDSRGYVVAVGLPGETAPVDADRLLAGFEARFGIPVSFAAPLRHAAS